MAAGAAKGGEGLDGHPVDPRSAFVCAHSFPSLRQILRRKDLLHHGSFLRAPMLLLAPTLTLASPAGFIGWRILRGIVALLIGSILHAIETSGFVFKRAFSSPRLVAHYYDLC